MERGEVWRRLEAATGQRPSVQTQAALMCLPEFKRALGDDPGEVWLDRCVTVWHTIVEETRPAAPEPSEGRQKRPGTKFAVAPTERGQGRKRERERARKQEIAWLATQDREVAHLRDHWQRAYTVKRLGAGNDHGGPWRDVEIAGRHVPGTVRLRIRREPLMLEVPPDWPHPWRTTGGVAGSVYDVRYAEAGFLQELRYVASVCGWSEEGALHYLTTGRPPKATPLVVRVTEGTRTPDGIASKAITIMAAPHVSPTKVAEEFAKAAGRREGKGAPLEARTAAAVKFVERMTVGNNGTRPPWPTLRMLWDLTYPWWAFGSYEEMAKCVSRGQRALNRKHPRKRRGTTTAKRRRKRATAPGRRARG